MPSEAKKPAAVRVRRDRLTIPSYLPAAPDKNPMFLDKRVYQGSSGKVYPLPFIDRVAEEKRMVGWDAVHLENEYIELTILPELGGRIHAGRDKRNGYDFVYRQEVIKPALVGLAGPWISGGIEFNWPQHHRPSTFLPADVEIEEESDGSVTVWMSEHEPMNRMKGMHGVRLSPGVARVELRARVCNRTEQTQTFLWWVNVATRAHERYQSFFPEDAHYVADHAKRSMSSFPLCRGTYYGIDYASRAESGVPEEQLPRQYRPAGGYAANDLSWYANIPVPTSYMCMATKEDFFGGYDHAAEAGLAHVANHHISPGKKQWTWGNQEFGYAWDRNLTDANASGEYPPYIELMAGVYTDNQPDFSFLAPGETKSWSQYWYPLQKLGIPGMANEDAAARLDVSEESIRIRIAATKRVSSARVEIREKGAAEPLAEWTADLSPDELFREEVTNRWGLRREQVELVVSAEGKALLRYAPRAAERVEVPEPAKEPSDPEAIESCEELFLAGLHLEQYRHATRRPERYWEEALRRDSGDARCNAAMGRWHLRKGAFQRAEGFLRKAIERLTRLNPNPPDGEPYYLLGITLRYLGREEEAYASLYKATWNAAWRSAAYFALAEIDGCQGNWEAALGHLDCSLETNTEYGKARSLKALVLRKLGRFEEADRQVDQVLAADPLDALARRAKGEAYRWDGQTRLDVAYDLARFGLNEEALAVVDEAIDADRIDPRSLGAEPMIAYCRAWLLQRMGRSEEASVARERAKAAKPDYCFPSRLEDMLVFEACLAEDPEDGRAMYYLATFYYDRERREEAIRWWEEAARREPRFATVWRNLGIAYFNVSHDPDKSREAYDKALAADPSDARVFYERDQLWKRIGVSPEARLEELEARRQLVAQRDDLSIELCALYNQTGSPERALETLEGRRFQPWEGGEGQALGQHTRARLSLGRRALEAGEAEAAREAFEAALRPPENLGEAWHPLANQSDCRYWLGVALDELGREEEARASWGASAAYRGDFQEMSVKAFSEMSYYSALSLRRLGEAEAGQRLLEALLAYAEALERSEAEIDYFATSLPTMLVFEDDIQERQETKALFLQAQAWFGLGQRNRACRLLEETLRRDPNHAMAADLMAEVARA